MEKEAAKSVIKAGHIVLISSGEYSDYRITGVFVALQDIDWRALRDEYLAANQDELEEYRFSTDSFLAHVISKGFLAEVNHDEWFLSAYNRANEMELR